jgi:hypothetical protein
MLNDRILVEVNPPELANIKKGVLEVKKGKVKKAGASVTQVQADDLIVFQLRSSGSDITINLPGSGLVTVIKEDQLIAKVTI